MRFGKAFKRRVGGSGSTPVLGTDAAPTGNPVDTTDNQMSWQLFNINGFPIQRIAVGYTGPALALTQKGDLYCYDDLTNAWFLCDTKQMVPGSITWFDQPTLGNTPGVGAGCLSVALVVTPPGADPTGTYTFVMGADISNAP